MLHLQEGEHINIKARKHWFLLFRNSFGILVIYFIPFIGWEFLINQINIPAQYIDPSLLLLILSTWTLFIWVKLFSIWTDYYLDIWIVTDNRIINIDQKGLFRRDVSILRMERIQDVTLEIHGIIATVLGFGNVHVQTAGESREFIIKGIKNPDKIKKEILGHVDTKTSQGAVSL